MNNKKYALFVFPGMLNQKIMHQICTDGLVIDTNRFPDIPARSIVKGLDFDILGCFHITNLSEVEIKYSINNFYTTDANIFYMHWNTRLCNRMLRDKNAEVIIFRPNSSFKYELIGRTIYENFNTMTTDWIKSLWDGSSDMKEQYSYAAYTLQCTKLLDRYNFIKSLNYVFAKLDDRKSVSI